MATKIYNVIDLQNIENNLAGDYELANNINASITSTWNPTTDRGEWQPSTYYAVDDYVLVSSYSPPRTYLCETAHTSEATFSTTNWTRWYDSYGEIPNAFGFTPITYFEGGLDGKGYAINELYIKRPITYPVGLFAVIDNAAIKSVKLTDVNIIGGGEVAAIAGLAYGTVTINECEATGQIGSEDYDYVNGVGGLIGENRALLTITKSRTSCSIIGNNYIGGIVGISGWGGIIKMSKSYSIGDIIGYGWGAGGLIGDSSHEDDLIEDSYSRSKVTGNEAVGGAFGSFYGGKFGNIYSTGLVIGNNSVGGLHGYNGGTEEISPCFWDIQTSGQATSISGTGKTTAQMKTKSTFTNWDFVTIWGIKSGINNGYPYLLAFAGPIANAIGGVNITEILATLLGKIKDDAGAPCEWRFRYRKTGTEIYTFTTWTNGKVTDNTFSKNITGLTGATQYEFAAQARNPTEGEWSVSKYFMTLSARKTKPVQEIITLQAIRNIEMATQSRFCTDGEGNAVFKSRYARNE